MSVSFTRDENFVHLNYSVQLTDIERSRSRGNGQIPLQARSYCVGNFNFRSGNHIPALVVLQRELTPWQQVCNTFSGRYIERVGDQDRMYIDSKKTFCFGSSDPLRVEEHHDHDFLSTLRSIREKIKRVFCEIFGMPNPREPRDEMLRRFFEQTTPEEREILFAKDTQGKTLMHLAAAQGDAELMGILNEIATSQQHANFLSNDNEGNTPLHLCPQSVGTILRMARTGSERDILLSRNDAGDTAFSIAMKKCFPTIIEYFWLVTTPKERNDLLAVDNKGNTPLHDALDTNIEQLLRSKTLTSAQRKALFAKNKEGLNPLDVVMMIKGDQVDKIFFRNRTFSVMWLLEYLPEAELKDLLSEIPTDSIFLHLMLAAYPYYQTKAKGYAETFLATRKDDNDRAQAMLAKDPWGNTPQMYTQTDLTPIRV